MKEPSDDPLRQESRVALRFCTGCGAPTGVAAKFCSACGAPVAGGESRWGSSPGACMPPHLAERVRAGRSALEGERKFITVLFADLKDSMQLMAERDPEEARVVLDAVLERMLEAVHRYDGTVNQVMGDGVMALFGAPLALDDHAVRACYAALRMQDSIRRYAAGMRARLPVPVQIRIGMNSGEVVVRSIGVDLRMDYTAVGATTHLAARMEQAAEPESIVVTAATKRIVERYVSLLPVRPVDIKGYGEPVEAWQVVGLGPARTRMQAAVRRGLSRLVGRESELAALRAAFERAHAGQQQVVALVGEPGIGKSRLAREVIEAERERGMLVLEAGSVSYGRATTHLPIADMLRAYFQIEISDGPAAMRNKVAARLAALGEEVATDLSAVLAFMDAAPADPAWTSLDPPQRRARTLDALRRLFLRESERQPVLVVFEDLQRIDPETQELLDALVKRLAGARLLLLVEYQPDYRHDWANRSYFTELRVEPLSTDAAEKLFESLAGGDAGSGRLKRLLLERACGNPFFLEESVLALAESGMLQGAQGAYRMAGALEAVRIPDTVQAVVAARIDRLAPADKALLETAAVVGKDVPLDVLAAVAGLDEPALQQGLARLRAAEFLYETRLFPDLEYTFKHAYTHEVAYGSLLGERRRALHARIAGSMQALYADRIGEYVERLAHHSFRGELWQSAVAYLRQAGLKAYERSAFRRAARWIEQALEALQQVPQDPGAQALAVDLRFDLRNALLASGQLDQIIHRLREAEQLALAIDDRSRLGRASAYVAAHFWLTGKHALSLQSGQRALDIAAALDDVSLRAPATFYLGAASHLMGDYPRALELLRKNVESLQGDLQRERFGMAGLPAVFSRTIRGWVYAELGEFETGMAEVMDARVIAEQVAHPFSLLSTYLVESVLHLRQGNTTHATPVLQRGHALARSERVAMWSSTFSLLLGLAYALTGRADDGLALSQQALPAAERGGGLIPFALVTAGELALAASRVEEARAIARRAFEQAAERGERGYEAWAWWLAGEVEADGTAGDIRRAGDCYRQALERADALGMRPLVARSRFGLGVLAQRADRAAEAAAHLQAAAALFRSMDMRAWLARAETLLAGHRPNA